MCTECDRFCRIFWTIQEELRRTCLHQMHIDMGASMTGFLHMLHICMKIFWSVPCSNIQISSRLYKCVTTGFAALGVGTCHFSTRTGLPRSICIVAQRFATYFHSFHITLSTSLKHLGRLIRCLTHGWRLYFWSKKVFLPRTLFV